MEVLFNRSQLLCEIYLKEDCFVDEEIGKNNVAHVSSEPLDSFWIEII